jgi:hypothetical protein
VNRLLLEQGLSPRAAAVILRQYGFEAIHVSEIGMERAEDIVILEKARVDEASVSRSIMIFTRISRSPEAAGLPWCCCALRVSTPRARRT